MAMILHWTGVFLRRLQAGWLFSQQKLEKDRSRPMEENFPLQLLWVVFGFFVGNLSGSFLNALRRYFSSDILLIFFLCLLFEFISSKTYAPSSSNTASSDTTSWDNRRKLWWAYCRRSVNLVKIGCLLGFFVDAYKVGS